MSEKIKKWTFLIVECFVLGFALTAGMAVCTLLFEIIFG